MYQPFSPVQGLNLLPILRPEVDCSYCNAPCCKLLVDLTDEEAERFESLPYVFKEGGNYCLAQREDGYCVYYVEGRGCSTYDDRPEVCSSYSCVGDHRIVKSNKYGNK